MTFYQLKIINVGEMAKIYTFKQMLLALKSGIWKKKKKKKKGKELIPKCKHQWS
jgi:hypothetical protein